MIQIHPKAMFDNGFQSIEISNPILKDYSSRGIGLGIPPPHAIHNPPFWGINRPNGLIVPSLILKFNFALEQS